MRLRVSLILAGIGLALVRPLAAFEGSIKYQITDRTGDIHAMTMTLAGGKMRTDMEVDGRSSISIIDRMVHCIVRDAPTRKSVSFRPSRTP